MTADHTPERLSAEDAKDLLNAAVAWAQTEGGIKALEAWPRVEQTVERILAAHLADVEARLPREGLGKLLDRLLSEHWPNAGVNAWYLADLLRAALHHDPSARA